MLPLALLDRPRVDVTLRISGLFRDAFETQIALFDAVVRAIAQRTDEAEWNPLAASARVLAIEYRLVPEARYPAQIDDVAAAVAWLREPAQVERFDLDPARIGVFGVSLGASVALAMAQPMLHHRSAAFEALFSEVREGLKWLYGTNEEVLTFAATAAGAMEGVVANFLRRGSKVVVVEGGTFGVRWTELCTAFGLSPIVYRLEWGDAADPQQVQALLQESPDVEAVLLQATESSTGVAHPVKEIAAVTRAHPGVLCVVDASTALGVAELPMDGWGIDVLLGASDGLMLPPGLSFGAASVRAWQKLEKCDQPRFYFDWKREREMQRRNQTAFTPAVSLIQGLREVINFLRTEGKEKVYARQERMSRATREAMTALGLTLFARRPAPGVTAVTSPIDSDLLTKTLRDRHGVVLLGGQDQLRGRIFRVSHVGLYNERDVLSAIAAIERALLEHGHAVELGKGLGAAQAVFAGR
ncbi:MAG: aminotransferase class V-fold PLP-dependent enzyme [Myxococcales bacterium]